MEPQGIYLNDDANAHHHAVTNEDGSLTLTQYDAQGVTSIITLTAEELAALDVYRARSTVAEPKSQIDVEDQRAAFIAGCCEVARALEDEQGLEDGWSIFNFYDKAKELYPTVPVEESDD